MRNHRMTIRFTLIFITVVLFASPAGAQVRRTFVSAARGDDGNTVINCNVAMPCRSFQAAVNTVAAGGEVVALDSGGYGPVTISKAVTLTGSAGVYAGITAASGNAINVTAGSTDTVVLRGLTLAGAGATNGVNATAFGVLHIEGCVISGFGTSGINVSLSADGGMVFVKDTITRNNNNGIFVATSSGTVRSSIDHCRAEGNGSVGFWSQSNSTMTISNSLASRNQFGFLAQPFAGAPFTSEMDVDSCVASNNTNSGFEASTGVGTAIMRLKGSTATGNSTGFLAFGTGTITFESLGNNMARGNTTANKMGTITVVTPD
jgi:hypothetical protein